MVDEVIEKYQLESYIKSIYMVIWTEISKNPCDSVI